MLYSWTCLSMISPPFSFQICAKGQLCRYFVTISPNKICVSYVLDQIQMNFLPFYQTQENIFSYSKMQNSQLKMQQKHPVIQQKVDCSRKFQGVKINNHPHILEQKCRKALRIQKSQTRAQTTGNAIYFFKHIKSNTLVAVMSASSTSKISRRLTYAHNISNESSN